MDQATQHVGSHDHPSGSCRAKVSRCRRAGRRRPNRPVRAVSVVLVDELAEDSHKVTPAQNQYAVQALAADGPHESLSRMYE